MRTMFRDIILGMGHEIAGEASNGHESVKLYAVVYPAQSLFL